MRSPDTAARMLVNPQEDGSMAGLRRVIQPLKVNGKTLDQVFLGAELLLLERGELGAMKLAQQLRDQHETVEYRTLLRLRQQGRGEKDGK